MVIRKIYNALYADTVFRSLFTLLMVGLVVLFLLPETWQLVFGVPYVVVFCSLIFRFVYVCAKVVRGKEIAPLSRPWSRCFDLVERVALLLLALLFLGVMIYSVCILFFG